MGGKQEKLAMHVQVGAWVPAIGVGGHMCLRATKCPVLTACMVLRILSGTDISNPTRPAKECKVRAAKSNSKQHFPGTNCTEEEVYSV
eukprot:1786134-Rhodomonas_salina.1